ncbi:ATPase [Altericroceibacterium xinjiangense]|uniref:ATPase n=1 Tax=Altericroceibacterium xinjiangense TaxID=762261 RepID=UPI000F7E469E|nr:ATPase [Altericroceibacterium xinjiangense]
MANIKNLAAVEPGTPEAETNPQSLPEAAPEASVETTDPGTADLPPQPEWIEQPVYEDESARGGSPERVAPPLAALAIAGWTAFFVFAHDQEMFAPATPEQWSGWIASWSMPVALIIALWLLAMRNSRREAGRFASAAHALSTESARLEERLVNVNRELAAAREFIAAQSRDLESLGRGAGERLSQHADRLQTLIRDNGEQVEAIGRVSSTALDNMNRLRGDLPVVSNSARDLANQIGSAGRVAQEQLEELIGGFHRLDQSGTATEQQMQHLRARTEEALQAFEDHARKLGEISDTRFAALAERGEAFRAEMDEQEAEVLASIRRRADSLSAELAARSAELGEQENVALEAVRGRIAEVGADGERIAAALQSAQGEASERWRAAVARLEERLNSAIQQISEVDSAALENARRRLAALSEEARRVDEAMAERTAAFEQDIARRREEAERQEGDALARLQERFETLDATIAQREQDYLARVTDLSDRGEALAGMLGEFSAEMERAVGQGDLAGQQLAQAVGALSAKLGESRDALNGTGELVSQLTDDSVRLLEVIRSSAHQAGGPLPEAVARAEERLAGFDRQTALVEERIDQTGAKGEALVQRVATAREEASAALEQLDALHDQLAQKGDAHGERLASLRDAIALLGAETEALAVHARDELQAALGTLEEASRHVIENIDGQQARAISALARRIGSEAAQAVGSAVQDQAGGALAELDQAAERSRQASADAARHFATQLEQVNELAANLERRVAQARQRAEEQVDNDFARRMALITDRLNSSAVDIGKALSNEVSDTAWASYLRGDRGIFTRRAVKLLDNRQARQLTEVYEQDTEFRETVNRYIRDFEAMLRSILSTRDGNALAVTLLSSDMGKLYVALAQGVNRLRD